MWEGLILFKGLPAFHVSFDEKLMRMLLKFMYELFGKYVSFDEKLMRMLLKFMYELCWKMCEF